VIPVLGKVTDPEISDKRCDLIFLRHTLHCMSRPVEWLKNVKKYMRPDSRLVVIDGDPDILGYGWEYENTKEEVLQMADEAGFLTERIETFLLPEDYLYVFRVKGGVPRQMKRNPMHSDNGGTVK
jgi:hypothetical protein